MTSSQPDRISLTFFSTTEEMGRVMLAFGQFLSNLQLDESFIASARVVLRELLANAVHHGNRSCADRSVSLEVGFLDKQMLFISIEDEGEGFDHRFFGTKEPVFSGKINRKGGFLICYLTDRIEFNQAGNRVTVYLSIPGSETEYLNQKMFTP